MPLLLNSNGEFFDEIMGMTVPTVATPGPQYALDLQNDLITRIAPHTHTGADNLDGYQLNSDSLNLTMDLQLNGNNVANVRSVMLESQSTTLDGANDFNNVYVVNGNLYYNNNSGTPVQITSGSSIASSTNFLSYTPFTASASYTIGSTVNYNLVNVQSAVGVINIQLPTVQSVTNGRFFIFVDSNNNASANNITVSVPPGSLNVFDNGATTFTIANNGGYFGIYAYEGSSSNVWKVFDQSVYNLQNLLLNTSSLSLTNSSNLSTDTSSIAVLDGSTTLNGAATFNSTAIFNGNTTLAANVNLDSTVGFSASSVTTLYSGSQVVFNSGSNLVFNSGSTSTSALNTTFTGTTNITANGIVASVVAGIEANVAGGIFSNAIGGITLAGGSTDWPTFTAGTTPTTRSYSKTYPIYGVQTQTSGPPWYDSAAQFPGGNSWGLQGNTSTTWITVPMVSLHNGANIASISIHFIIGQNHGSNPPQFPPQLNVAHMATSGATMGGTGFVSLTGGFNSFTGVDYTNATSGQTFTLNCISNTVSSANVYLLQLLDETGTNSLAANRYFAYTVNYTNISNMAFP